ncbi:RraA family protein [Celeribacter sp.]|uniref:RraA family protein n=1 Tax=Celeribacter sp. TaxID=1890673 RepID=UPI003A8E5E58
MIEAPALLTIHRNTRRPTAAQIARFKDMPSAFVADAMSGRGCLATAIGPIGGGRDYPCNVVGPALVADNSAGDLLATGAALNILQKGDIVVAAVDGYQGSAAAGDLVMGMMKNAGAAGFVTDGPMRDYEGIVAVGLPAYCTGLNANSPYGNGPGTVGAGAVVGGVRIETGDLLVCDSNGVVVVPFDKIDAVADAAHAVKNAEAEFEVQVQSGAQSSFLDLDEMLADGRAVFAD